MHHKEVSTVGMEAYIEGLKDLNPTQIDMACAKALHEVDRMPTVAHIRQRVYVGNPLPNRPEYLDDAPTSEEDRAEGLKFSAKLKETLANMDKEVKRPSLAKFAPVDYKELADYHRGYLMWLAEQNEKDKLDREAGRNPPPRSSDEKQAMFWALPISERKRLQRKEARLKTKS